VDADPAAVGHCLEGQHLHADGQEGDAAEAVESVAGGKAGDAPKRQLLAEGSREEVGDSATGVGGGGEARGRRGPPPVRRAGGGGGGGRKGAWV